MIYQQATKDVVGFFPQARLNNGSFTVTSVDRKGFDYLQVLFILGATDIGITALKLQEADDNSTFTDITGADFSATTLPSSSNGSTVWRWDVDLKGRKRYIRPVVTVGNGTLGAFAAGVYILDRAEQFPYSGNINTMGLTGLLTV